MNIGWLCPYTLEPHIVVGAVVEGFDTVNNRAEYIPVILPESTISECLWRGPAWVISMIPGDFFAFDHRISAEGFLFDTFKAFRDGNLSVEAIESMLDRWSGKPRNIADYGVLVDGSADNLN